MALLGEKRRGYKGQVDFQSKTVGIRFWQVKTLEHRTNFLQKKLEKSAKEDKNRGAGYEAENKIPQGLKHKSAHPF